MNNVSIGAEQCHAVSADAGHARKQRRRLCPDLAKEVADGRQHHPLRRVAVRRL